MHVPTLPSKASWETPIAASRDIVEAISDAADSAVDVATSAVRSARRRRSGHHAPTPSWRWAVGALAVAVAVALVVRGRRRGPSNGSPLSTTTVDPAGVGRSEPARPAGRAHDAVDDLLDDAQHAHTASAD